MKTFFLIGKLYLKISEKGKESKEGVARSPKCIVFANSTFLFMDGNMSLLDQYLYNVLLIFHNPLGLSSQYGLLSHFHFHITLKPISWHHDYIESTLSPVQFPVWQPHLEDSDQMLHIAHDARWLLAPSHQQQACEVAGVSSPLLKDTSFGAQGSGHICIDILRSWRPKDAGLSAAHIEPLHAMGGFGKGVFGKVDRSQRAGILIENIGWGQNNRNLLISEQWW